ncbi:MAG: MGH1-like glycoside hydrolase domain-containing protein [Kiritimatiellia bacterium]
MLKRSWNTWNVRSVMSHVLLPEGFAISLGVKSYSTARCLREGLIGRKGKGDEVIVPGPRSYDGSCTSLDLTWQDVQVGVETAVEGGDWFCVVTPRQQQVKTAMLSIEVGVLWGRNGHARRDGDTLVMENGNTTVSVACTGTKRDEPVVEISSPYVLVVLDGPVCISTNPLRLGETAKIVAGNKQAFLATRSGRDAQQEIYDAMQICLAWDTIYDPYKDRVISPVSRIWSCDWGGWVLFDWDTYFAAWMAGLENKDLAYDNARAITEEVTEAGFIPNMATASGFKSRDRSQPPVGALTVRALCDMFQETILAKELFEALLRWNRWWPQYRDQDGYLCWGSNPYEPVTGCSYETVPLNTRFASALESGLDNSPMYKDIPYDAAVSRMQMADVGLMSFYITDCRELAELARRIGRNDVVAELEERAHRYAAKLKTLWCEKTGLFLNKRLDNGELQHRYSPTHFYPLLAKVATQEQARRMIDEHFFNPEEFWGEWMLPSIARNDEEYPIQNYWKGRIWAPMNFLVYLGLCNYDLPEARKALVEKSAALLLKEWREHGHVHENYNADTGEGCGIGNSDAFYHWGGLLGLISVLENRGASGPATLGGCCA